MIYRTKRVMVYHLYICFFLLTWSADIISPLTNTNHPEYFLRKFADFKYSGDESPSKQQNIFNAQLLFMTVIPCPQF